MVEVISEEYRKANKKHECDYCLGDIEKGEFYKVSTLKYDDVYRWKSHRECEFLADEFHRSGLFEDYGNGMVQEDFEECVEQVYDSFVNPEYEHGSTFQSRLKEVYNFLCENSIELEITKSYGMAFKAVKREYPVILDYMQGRVKMKPEEAIVWVKDTRYIYENMNPDIELSKLKCEAFNLAIEALEKQVPKKTIHAHGNYYCPTCKDTWLLWDDAIPNKDNFCRHCGQRIDWSVGE